MVELARQDAMPAAMAREKHHFSASQRAGEQLIGSYSERRFYRAPFLVFKAFNIVKAAAADDADAVGEWRHGFFIASGLGLG